MTTTPIDRLLEPCILRRLSKYAYFPTYGTEKSSCFDIAACLPKGTIVTLYTSSNQEQTFTIALSNEGLPIRPGDRVLVPTGWAIRAGLRNGDLQRANTDMDSPRWSLRIYSRSGLALKRGLVVANGVGVVDADYRKEVFVILTNTSAVEQVIKDGDRIAQGELVYNPDAPRKFTMLDCSDEMWFGPSTVGKTTRVGGFGSTGVDAAWSGDDHQ